MTATHAATQPPPGKATPVYHVPIGDVRPNPRNPRRTLGDLDDLVASIREHGVLQPCVGRRTGAGVTLIMGERRLEASKRAGRTTIPVILLSDKSPDRELMMAMAENLHRATMVPTDEARACRELLDMGYEREDVATLMIRSPKWVTDRLALLELPIEIQRKVDNGQMNLAEAIKIGHLVRRRQNGTVTHNDRAPRTFVKTHPLGAFATAMCNEAGHPKRGRVGPACGNCWEQSIRMDERNQAGDKP